MLGSSVNSLWRRDVCQRREFCRLSFARFEKKLVLHLDCRWALLAANLCRFSFSELDSQWILRLLCLSHAVYADAVFKSRSDVFGTSFIANHIKYVGLTRVCSVWLFFAVNFNIAMSLLPFLAILDKLNLNKVVLSLTLLLEDA